MPSTQIGLTREIFLNVNEWFGPTLQGEGRHAGRRVSFLRLANCNLSCSWCDTKYTWDWENYDRSKEVHRKTLSELIEIVQPMERRIIVTGGEPLTQATGLSLLMREFPDRLWEVETNGTRPLKATSGLWSTVTCSPKIIPSADAGPKAHELADDVLEVADFKFVIHDEQDVAVVERFIQDRSIDPERVWLMPEGITAEELTARTPEVSEAALRLGTNFTSRLHVYAWHEVRGH